MDDTSTNYIFDPSERPKLPLFDVPVVKATESSVRQYGELINDPENYQLEIVQWPAQGWRPVDPGTGNEGGYVEGIFSGKWIGHILYGSNEAVGGEYVLGWSASAPWTNIETTKYSEDCVLLWHMNYHPDGGQLFYPLDKSPFVVPVALPGDDFKPSKVVGFWFDGSCGFYIHPNIWHEGIFPISNHQRFLDKQGRVHARISCDVAHEFGTYLCVPLPNKL